MVEFANGEKQVIGTPQGVYDAFNSLIFSTDTKVLGKLLARAQIAQQTADVPGDIVECGVFKGSGLATWLKLKRVLAPRSFKRVIGFDFFDTDSLLSTLAGLDRQRMDELFSERGFKHSEGAERFVYDALVAAGFTEADFELVRGDVAESTRRFCARRPGFKASVLYMDLDLGQPTYDALKELWPRLSRGGLVVFDEYGYHQWSESTGADRFADEVGVKIRPLPFSAPTAIMEKP